MPPPGTPSPSSPTGTELPKQYRPAETEPRIRERWEKSSAFHAEAGPVLSGRKKPYCILIPPPNVTAALHVGHALNNTLQDILVRAKRMMGFETLWMPGTDHAGIATQAVVEKRLRAEGKLTGALKQSMKREAFVAQVQAFKDEYEATITGQLKAMGCSCDWARQRFTMDEQCTRAVREAFFRLFKDGLIYRGKRLVNWDPVLQTAVADDETEDVEVDGWMYYLRYPLVRARNEQMAKGQMANSERGRPVTWSELRARGWPVTEDAEHGDEKQAWVTVATTRPETYLGDTAVAVNPRDPRAKALRGLCAELPLVGRVIPIVEDGYVVLPAAMQEDPEEAKKDPKAAIATGFLKVTPAHDPNDYELGQRHAPPLAIINVMAPDATISDKHGWTDVGDAHIFVGKSREEARRLVIREFKERTVGGELGGAGAATLFAKAIPYRHSVPHSDRSKAAIEPYLSDQWYCKVTDPRFAQTANAALVEDQRSGGTGLRPVSEVERLCRAVSSPVAREILDTDGFRPVRIPHFVPCDPYPPHEPKARGLIERIRNLPHLEMPRATYFVTWKTVEGVSLNGPELSATLDALRFWDGKTCQVYAAAVMSTHVHALIRPEPELLLGDWVASVKKFSARQINKMRGRSGPLWQDERFDHIVRDYAWFAEFLEYIVRNPVEAGVVSRASEYQWTYVHEDVLSALAGLAGTAQESRTTQDTGRRPVPPRPGHWSETSATSVGDGSLRFYPARYSRTYENWHDNIRDWCISRQLWWGHRIPVWHIRMPSPWDPTLPQDLKWNLVTHGLDHALKSEIPGVAAQVVDAQTGQVIPNDEFLRLSKALPVDTTRRFDLYLCMLDSRYVKYYEDATCEQDPDVLDTWFSSALWPLSTMGWPEETEMLRAFNPSSTLCTAREIITLWVSRMVMFNRYFLPAGWPGNENPPPNPLPLGGGPGPAPFRDVFIHAMIQDGDGRKMSKSLGNGVDPLDIIATHGADAMRFTLCHMTTQTQDVRMPVRPDPTSGKNTSEKFDLGRNFANKLWNAARFGVGMLGTVPSAECRVPSALGVVDRWMLSRLCVAVAEVEAALKEYQFSEYAGTVYDLLWRDFCDWYLEAIKPTAAENASQRAVLRAALDVIVRLLHPVMPFITEAIHERLKEIPAGTITGIDLETSDLLCTSGWPRVGGALRDEAAELQFERVRGLVTAIREVRAQHQVSDKRRITLHAPGSVVAQLGEDAALVATLARVERITADAPAAGAAAFRFEGAELHAGDLADGAAAVDAGAEKERLARVIAECEKRVATFDGRLNNAGYMAKAPAKLVEESKAQRAKAAEELAAARAAIARLG